MAPVTDLRQGDNALYPLLIGLPRVSLEIAECQDNQNIPISFSQKLTHQIFAPLRKPFLVWDRLNFLKLPVTWASASLVGLEVRPGMWRDGMCVRPGYFSSAWWILKGFPLFDDREMKTM